MLRAGPIVIDVRSREVRVCDRVVELSAKEYQLLVTLAGEPTRVFTREELMRADEVFFTGTAAEVTPVRELDGTVESVVFPLPRSLGAQAERHDQR